MPYIAPNNLTFSDSKSYQTEWSYGTTYLTSEVDEYLQEELNNTKLDVAQKMVSLTLDQAVFVVIAKPKWVKQCHCHPADAQATVLKGTFFIQTHGSGSTEVISFCLIHQPSS